MDVAVNSGGKEGIFKGRFWGAIKRFFSHLGELLPLAFFTLLLVVIILILATFNSKALSVVVLNATATCNGFHVALRFNTNVSGVFAEYAPLYQSKLAQRVVGTCNGTRSDLARFAKGQVAVCHFPATLPNGTKYTVVVLTVDGQGYTWKLEEVGPLRVVCKP